MVTERRNSLTDMSPRSVSLDSIPPVDQGQNEVRKAVVGIALHHVL